MSYTRDTLACKTPVGEWSISPSIGVSAIVPPRRSRHRMSYTRDTLACKTPSEYGRSHPALGFTRSSLRKDLAIECLTRKVYIARDGHEGPRLQCRYSQAQRASFPAGSNPSRPESRRSRRRGRSGYTDEKARFSLTLDLLEPVSKHASIHLGYETECPRIREYMYPLYNTRTNSREETTDPHHYRNITRNTLPRYDITRRNARPDQPNAFAHDTQNVARIVAILRITTGREGNPPRGVEPKRTSAGTRGTSPAARSDGTFSRAPGLTNFSLNYIARKSIRRGRNKHAHPAQQLSGAAQRDRLDTTSTLDKPSRPTRSFAKSYR